MSLWSGRFTAEPDEQARQFTHSLAIDRRLYRHDIAASVAHVKMLGQCKIIPPPESEEIIRGLNGILNDIESGALSLETSDEDIHTFVERVLTERIGPAGGKLHTARSRNDQVATDVRLYLRDEIDHILNNIIRAQTVITDLARAHLSDPMPGYTHLQRAQPVLLSHHLLAYFWMLERDMARLEQCRERVNVLPLGSGALSGTTFDIDRHFVAKELGFERISENSMDAVSDRDFMAEFTFDVALLMVHMSRMCEELVLWSSVEFGFVEFDDRYSTGSSMMPQKKNPDVAELARGKTGRVVGDVVTLLVLLKGLPLTYNRDLQEDKAAVFDAADTAKLTLSVLTEALSSISFRTDRMREFASDDLSLATDLADSLTRSGLPFREAHTLTGKLVRYCIENKRLLTSLTSEELRDIDPRLEGSSVSHLCVETAIDARNTPGGTSSSAVEQQLKEASDSLQRKIRR